MKLDAIQWRNAALVGFLAALLEGTLIGLADPGIEAWHFAQAVLFWFTCGFVVYFAKTGLAEPWNGVFLTVLLSSPWFIVEAIRPKKYEHLLPLLIASVIVGLIIGFTSRKLRPHA